MICRFAPVAAILVVGMCAPTVARAEDYYPKRNWDGFYGGELNTSAFVFRDVDRNGVYDLGDRPMPSVAVELRKSGGKAVMERTNVDGFANFKMSVLKRDRPVTNPGRYAFRVVPPPGWSLTTGNALQESGYRVLPGAPGDMVAETPTRPVGLAVDLVISGPAAVGAHVTATAPDGRTVEAEVGDDGRYTFAAAPGVWHVALTPTPGGVAQVRSVTVGQAPVVLSAFPDPSETPAALPQHAVAGFDDLILAPVVREIPAGYGGLDWHNLVAMHQRFASGPGYINTAVSGEFVAYTSSGHPAEVSHAQPFDFAGAYLGAGWNSAEGETVILQAWRGDALVREDWVTVSAMGPVYFDADYRSITRLRIGSQHYWQIVVDDFVYRTSR